MNNIVFYFCIPNIAVVAGKCGMKTFLLFLEEMPSPSCMEVFNIQHFLEDIRQALRN